MSALRRSGGLAICVCLSLLLCASIAVARSGSRVQAATAHRIVSAAQHELSRHVHEVPDGSNNSRDIARYRSATVGAMRGAPWCAYFVSYIAKRAGVPLGWHGEGMGYVPYIRDWARKTHRWSERPRPGYLITFPQHVGIVEHVYGNRTLTTIEGNTSNAVLRRYHRWGDAVGYVKLATGGSVEAPATPAPAPTVVEHQPLVARMRVYPGTTAAIGDKLDFSGHDSSGEIVKYRWDFDGDGKWDASGPDASHTYRRAGTFTVKLEVSDAKGRHSTAKTKLAIHANQPPHAELSLSSDQVHLGETVRMDASGARDDDGRIVKYEWDYTGAGLFEPGGVRASHQYSQAGTYMVRVRVTDDSGNTAEASRQLTVAPFEPPVAVASCDRTHVTTGQSIRCTADDSRSRYRVSKHEWDIDGDGHYDLRGGTVTFSYPKAGDYTARMLVTDVNGNTAQTQVAVQVDDIPPKAKITPPASVTRGTPATFSAAGSTDADGQISGYEWDTGSGYQPGDKTLTTTFTTSGPHTVRLRVTDDGGQTAETSWSFTLANSAPTARITAPASPYINAPAAFDAGMSTDADGTIDRYDWDLNGDGTYETSGATPAFTYTATGQYTVRLKVTDNLGAVATTTAVVTVRDPADVAPIARLVLPLGAYARTAATFNATGSSDPDGTIKSWRWDFNGDGVVDKTTTTGSTTWTYATAGTYQVSVTVVDDKWSEATATASLRVN